MASNLYHEIIQVEVRDQSRAALNTVQKNVQKTEADLNRVSKNPYSVTLKLNDLLTRPLQMLMNTARGLANKALSLPVTLADKFSAPFRNMMSGLKMQGEQMVMGIGQGIGQQLLNVAGQGFGMVKGAIIGMNATLETSTLQFETLMGDADRARAHVQSLFEFAKKTPFETQPVIDASRLLRTFGGDALDTQQYLTMFGDAAAATGGDIKDISFWMGRAYAAIQAGQPFGEARMRLQELAVLSPQAAQKIEQLEKAGAKGDQIWKAFSGDLNRFSGAMAKQASTWSGLTSSLSDAIAITSAEMFQPLFVAAKDAVAGLLDFLSSADFEAWAKSAGATMATFVTNLAKGFGTLVTGVQALFTAFTSDSGAIGVIYDLIRDTFGQETADMVQPFLQSFMDAIPSIKQFASDVVSALSSIWNLIQMMVTGDFKGGIFSLEEDSPVIFFFFALRDAMIFTATVAIPGLIKAGTDVINTFRTMWEWLEKNKWAQSALVGVISALTAMFIIQNAVLAIRTAILLAQAAPMALWVAQMYAAAAAQALLNAVMMLNPFVLIAGLLIGLAAALVFAYNTNEDFRNMVNGAWESIKQVVGPIITEFGRLIDWLWHNVIEPAIPAIVKLWEDLKNNTLTVLLTLPLRLVEIGAEMVNGLIKGLGGPDLLGWIRTNITDKIPQFIKDALGIHSPSLVFEGIGTNIMQGLINGLQARMPDIMAFMSNLSNVFGGTDVGGWIDAAIQATGVPASWAGPLSQIIQHESGGNPMAMNTTDINAQNNNASVGLMQLTGTNRAHYTPAGMDPMDPIAQIIAGIRYIQDRYGDIANVPGVSSLAAGGAYQPYDRGGVLPPGMTLAANTTGANEFVLTPGQMAAMGGGGLVFAPVFQIDASGAAPGVGDEVSAAVEEQASRLFSLLGSQLRVAFGNMASEGLAT